MLRKTFLYICTFLFFTNFLFADRLQEVQQSGVLKAGVKYDFEPFGYINEDGDVVGFDIDLLHYIAKDLGVTLQMQQVTSKNRIAMIENNTIDIAAASMTHKISRDTSIDFTISYFFDGQALLTRKYCKKRKATGFNGKEVGAIEGATSGENLKKVAPKVRIIYFKTYDEAIIALEKGEIDAITTDLVWCSVQAKKSNDEFKVLNDTISFEPYGMGVPENESNFRDAINFAIQKSVLDGTYIKLYKKWFHKEPETLPEVWPN